MEAWLAGGALGAIAAAVLVARLSAGTRGPSGRAALAALAATVLVLGPTVALLTQETVRFARLGLTEAGATRNRPPPLDEGVVRAAKAALRAGESWSLETPDGRCGQDEYAFYWLAFRLYPNAPDCDRPAVAVYVGVAPPSGAEVVERGPGFVVAR